MKTASDWLNWARGVCRVMQKWVAREEATSIVI
jgi:hypothetical protein